jgi:hypothetical protein
VLVALRLPGVDVGALLQVHRRHVVELMQRYTHIKAESSADDDPGLPLVVDAELFRLEGIVRWLDAADARLGQRRSGAPALPSVDPQSAPSRLEAQL